MKEAGYVYILTNPSFKEDWVKIGKSSRPVDIRSKELDNTAVPLPFEIYATLKTTKYNEVEQQLHQMIDKLTDIRIRPNREFFNIAPQKALELLTIISKTLDDSEIEEVYKQRNSHEINPANTLHNEDEIFNANIAVRENIINAIKQVIDPEHRIENKMLVRHFKAYSSISYEKNYLWFVRIYFNRTWDKAYLSFPNHTTGVGEINKSKLDSIRDTSKFADDLNRAIRYIINTFISRK